LTRSFERQDVLFSTGIILQELLQGLRGPKHRTSIIEYFAKLPLIEPNVTDHIEAAALQATCRRKGIQVGTIDALLAQLAIAHDLELLTTGHDFVMMSRYVPLRILLG
jgi:predicted nucleic acid-binding protein